MCDAQASMAAIEARVAAWAQREHEIRAVCVIGSRARVDHPADANSDLDLVLLTVAPDRLLEQDGWLAQLGTPWLSFIEPTTVGGGSERRVLFAGGADVDFAVFTPAQFDAVPLAALASVVGRGVRILLDTEGQLARVQARLDAQPPARPGPPSLQEYQAVGADFWYHALWVARKLRRGELYTAKAACDGHMKDLLVRMLGWHAGATRDWARDTWHRGRFLEEWADPRALVQMREAYAHYTPADIARALGVTMQIFGWVARETAVVLGDAYPTASEEQVVALVAVVLDPGGSGGS